jgi:two-component system, OmpR family, sensor histidine kinase CiaH
MRLFQSATLKLTAWYMVLIMCVSIGFSMLLYGVSSHEIGRGIPAQADGFMNQLAPYQSNQYFSWRQQRANNLVLINVFMVLAGGISSYALARYTLKPIADAMDAQARFTSDASHELRTPLSVMRTEIEVALKKKMTSSAAAAILVSNLEEITRLEGLVDRLLKLSVRQSVTLVPVQLEDVAIDATTRMVAAAQARRIGIDNSAQAVMVRGDKDALADVVSICLDNAIKYSPEGSDISIHSKTDAKTASLVIVDAGSGIAPEDLDHIFERFYRADSSRSKSHVEGYGLGLSLAKKIIDLHKGTITISSRKGHGTTVTVTVPRADTR